MDVLASIPWGSLTTPALLGLAVLSILRGDLVPRKFHEEAVSRERESVARLSELLDQLGPSMEQMADELAQTTTAILTARKGG